MAVLRLLTDENISPRVVAALRDAGYHVIDVKEAHRFGWTDDRILAWATDRGCAVVTHDKDFAGLLRNPFGRRHAGVILLRFHNPQPAAVTEKLLSILARLRTRRLQNALLVASDETVEYLR